MSERSDFTRLNRRAVLAAGGSSLVLASCGGILSPSQEPLQLYLLRPQLGPLGDLPATNMQLGIGRPEAVQSLATTRIALERGETMDYYADSQWSDTVPRLLQSLLVEAFETSGRVKAVAPESEGLRADVQLQTELRDFSAHYDSQDGSPDVVVSMVARLLTVDHGTVIGTFEAKHDARAAQNSVPSIVSAFDEATAGVLEDVARWTLTTVSQAGLKAR